MEHRMKNKIKSSGNSAIVEFNGKNELNNDVPHLPYVLGTLKSVSIKCETLVVAWEEKKRDKSSSNGIKYILLDGGEIHLKSKKNCIIS